MLLTTIQKRLIDSIFDMSTEEVQLVIRFIEGDNEEKYRCWSEALDRGGDISGDLIENEYVKRYVDERGICFE